MSIAPQPAALTMIASNVVGVEGREVPPRQVEGGPLDARVVMDRAAADLAARDHDLAAVLLEHPRGRGGGLGVHGVGHAAEEQRHPRPLRADRRQDVGQRAARPVEVGEHRLHPAEGRRQEPGQPDRLGQVEQAEPLEQPRRQRAPAFTRPE